MYQTTFNIEQYTNAKRISKTGVTAMAIHNYGSSIMKVIVNAIVFEIPPFDAAKFFARSFDMIPCDNSYSNIEFDIEFVGGTGKAILMYKEITNVDNC